MLDLVAILDVFRNTSINIVKNLDLTVKSMLVSLAIIDLTMSMFFNKDDGLDIFMTLMKKILLYGFFGWIIFNYQEIVLDQTLTGFIELGNKATGIDSTIFGFNIGNFLENVMLIVAPAMVASGGTVLTLDALFIESIPIGMVFLMIGSVFFVVMTILEIMITFIKFYLVAGFAFIFMPFGVFSKTKDIAMKGLHAIFAMGVEIMVLVGVVNLVSDSMMGGTIDAKTATLSDFVMYFVASIFFFFLIKRVPSIVSTLLSGTISSMGMTGGGAGIAMGMVASGGRDIGSAMKNSYNAYKNASNVKSSSGTNSSTEAYKSES
ncbi:type IV secretion system protein [Psychrilyobacter sp.]|uniref:type IV secretion system protein n=1 Tax=Psychrilyobacter sp. TaxID=2586924 RepID=UPI003015B948